jgi:hypothetical protein
MQSEWELAVESTEREVKAMKRLNKKNGTNKVKT